MYLLYFSFILYSAVGVSILNKPFKNTNTRNFGYNPCFKTARDVKWLAFCPTKPLVNSLPAQFLHQIQWVVKQDRWYLK